MADLEVSLVDPNYVSRVWEEVEPILGKSIGSAHGRYDMKDILKEIVNFEQHLWVVFDEKSKIIAALTTRFVSYPKKKVLAGQFLGGTKIMRWRDPMLSTLENWAKDNSCDGLEMTGRNGFEKVLGPYGWTPEYVVFEKMFEEKVDG
tara:strand:+ start:8069 stop:8509 length:441 start_codon:yes stop_codon:yes gene_type:complete